MFSIKAWVSKFAPAKSAADTLIDLGVPMGLVLASIHERRDAFRRIFQEAMPNGDAAPPMVLAVMFPLAFVASTTLTRVMRVVPRATEPSAAKSLISGR